MEQNTSSNLFELQVDHNSSAYLGETARWARFLAILGFISCGLLLLFGIFFTSIMGVFFGRMESSGMTGAAAAGGMLGGFVSFLYICLAALYFFPCLYLYNFASRMIVALRSNDQEKLAQAFKSLKSCFRFIGILTIIVLGLWLLGIIFGGIGAAFSH